MVDRDFARRVAVSNKKLSRASERATARWADGLIAQQSRRRCGSCSREVGKADRFCRYCGEAA